MIPEKEALTLKRKEEKIEKQQGITLPPKRKEEKGKKRIKE